MDMATRFPPRARAGSYLDRDSNVTTADAGSGGELESNPIRRKFQRTGTDPDLTSSSDNSTTFRKPLIPASATRAAAAAPGLEHRPSLNQHQRKRSTLQRENVRVPSGPRDFPSSPGKQRKGSTPSTAPSMAESTNTSRSYLPQPDSSFFYDPRMASSHTRLTFGNPTDENAYSPTATTPGTEGPDGFLPDVNFDDFQNTINSTSIKNYDASGPPYLSDFPTVPGGRLRLKEEDYSMPRSNGVAARGAAQQQQPKKTEVGRTDSFRQRLASGERQASAGQQRSIAKESGAYQAKDESWRGRRQSSISQPTASLGVPSSTSAARPPRKSLGPGVITNLTKASSGQQNLAAPADSGLRPALARDNSLNKSSRRTTIQPAVSTGAELPRVSTLTATTQSRQNKVKSLQPPPRDQQEPNSTPNSAKSSSSSKSNQNRAHTPSSSGNRRQSIVSGRAPSGLGARTISPTDARRLKRISMMQAPPMPSTTNMPGLPTPSAQDELSKTSSISSIGSARLTEASQPRVTQPSPSMIPRKTSNPMPSSTRTSPDLRAGGISLSTKSSFSSLNNMSLNGSSSRLPTPKPKQATQSGSAMGQYRDQYGYSAESQDQDEPPPVPAIPKAYESPQDLETQPPFFSSSRSSQPGIADSSWADRQLDGSSVPVPWTSQTSRTSFDAPSETPPKHSGSASHSRTNTNGSTTVTVPPSAPPKTVRVQPDPNGRKNAYLQPLRLPPLNLMPINTRSSQNNGVPARVPRASEEVDNIEEYNTFQTPEPKRAAKTPSTPMTASKATFFRRQEDANKALRSSSSHYALRDVMGMDADGNMITKFWDDSDVENAGVPIPNANCNKSRNAITPFASGSLPKASAEFARLRAKPSGEYSMEHEYENLMQQNAPAKSQTHKVRMQRGATVTSIKSSMDSETQRNLDSPVIEPTPYAENRKEAERKDQSIRRRLSLGWRRSSSKGANHDESKGSPQQLGNSSERLQKQMASEMPPPKLPASANTTWNGDLPSLPSTTRPSLDTAVVKRKSQVPTSVSTTSLISSTDVDTTGTPGLGLKTRSQHSEQPTPVSASTSARSSSWGTLSSMLRSNPNKPATASRHRLTPSTISATSKDKDDLAADDEMARLSRKRKDVDSAARESEELKKRAIARSPVSADNVLHDYRLSGGSVLNVFERGEIIDYEKEGVYFTGTRNARKIIGTVQPSPQPSSITEKSGSSSNNFGYDDERGDYNIILGDHLAYRYEVVDVLGKGSFGQVVRCVDHKDGGVVAVKIIRNKKRFHQQALVEVGILGKLREWDPDGANATLSITCSFYFRSHLCIVTPCLSINLYEFIRAHNFTGFSLPLIRRFARQLLACLTLLQTKRIIHCDLKPENILLCEARKADVRVIDFGSSCREEEKVYTYIQSRFYRSPEVILGSTYGLGIDMWSLGCILAELWTGYPIFPGENEQEQLACIMEIFGPPDRHLVDRCTRKKLFFDSVGKPRVTVSSKGRRRRPSSKTLQQALKTEDEPFIDFITRCLRWDPDRRMKPSEAVQHPFITNLPLNQRPGIPEEARRAAKVRGTTAVPATNGQTIPSPTKRNAASSGNAFAQQQPSQTTATPARDKNRAIPETPQTAVRNGVQNASSTNMTQGSPVKNSTNPNRRHSTVATAGAAAMAGSKRASNGIVVGAAAGLPSAQPQQQRGASGNLAQLAARESMGAAGNATQSSAARWRT